MKKRNLQRIFAAFMASAMAMNLAACSSKEAEKPADETKPADTTTTTTTTTDNKNDVADTTTTAPVEEQEEEIDLFKDANGNVVDLGGMEIIIRDWWSTGEVAEPTNDYEEATQEWRQYIQDTYNFKIKELAISDWGSCPADFVDYVTTGGDDINYAFVVRADPAITSAMSQGLMYDLSTIDCLDFSDDLFQQNKTHDLYAMGSSVYAMAAGVSEPRTGVYFNNNILEMAGYTPDDIYDMQANGTWTWDKFDEILGKAQRDLDGDEINDIYGLTVNESVMTDEAVFANNGSYVGKDAAGNYTYNLESAETLEALEWCVDMYNKYDNHDPEGANWDYYKEEFLSGKVCAMVDDFYCGRNNGFLADADFEMTYVMFPMGPKAKTYVNIWSNNPVAIPACYDADRAWKIAFAWMMYNTPAPGYEEYGMAGNLAGARSGVFDERAVLESVTMQMEGEHGTINLAAVIPNMQTGSDLTWGIGVGAVVSEKVEAIRDTWKSYIDQANGK